MVGERRDRRRLLLRLILRILVVIYEVFEKCKVGSLVNLRALLRDICRKDFLHLAEGWGDGSVVRVRQLPTKLSMRLVMLFLHLLPLVNHCPVHIARCNDVVHFVFLVNLRVVILLRGIDLGSVGAVVVVAVHS